MSKLANKVAIVTGGSKGIGAAVATALAAQGAAVVVNYASSRAGAEAVVAAIVNAGGKAIAVPGDVSKAEEALSLVDAAISAFGRLDILVNNAGVYEFAALDEITEAAFHRIFNINVLGLLLATQAAAKHLGEGASVINISSGVTSARPPNSAVYAGSKGAVDVITGVLAVELGARKIRVNAIGPGVIDTEGARDEGLVGADGDAAILARTLLGRIGRPDDIADIAVFLASDDSRWLTGEKLLANGGRR